MWKGRCDRDGMSDWLQERTMICAMQHTWRAARLPVLPVSCLAIARMGAHQMAEAVQHKKTVLKSVKEIPGPPTFPVIGCLPTLFIFGMTYPMKSIHKMFLDLSKKYGPIVRLENPQFPPAVMVTDPINIEAMIRITMDNPLRYGFFSLKKIRYEAIDNYFEKKGGLLVENGDEWWRVRSRVQTPMLRSKNVSSYLPEVDQVTLTFVERMASLQKQHGEMPKDFQTELYKWALECKFS
ncbi:putative cytochrome P450 301a1, mitochondrial [Portunus trituberculatus]|uniref:Putative cytochrome P450 301a1, mitochondrial n=1 Tax=Portunus trituberculatus TaxID=210409 RepID=A0A5B7CKG4_PORTR|nr:putative cytochrome P450 301a1, mitochondrial [Portunus trituberculatus]